MRNDLYSMERLGDDFFLYKSLGVFFSRMVDKGYLFIYVFYILYNVESILELHKIHRFENYLNTELFKYH